MTAVFADTFHWIAPADFSDSFHDRALALTDCISMETMRRAGLADVLTNDRHFGQEGFRALFLL